tara:strand:- start:6636 stop:7586 length:951 start_codon:yes stop_codon:yes gene_type:complete
MNKTSDGRYIEKRVVIDSVLLRKILVDIKTSKKYTWKELSSKLGFSEQTVRNDWIRKRQTVPLSVFKQILSLSNNYSWVKVSKKIKLKIPFWGQSQENKTKKVTIPDINSEDFAEFYGVMLGDGCVFSNLRGFSITGDKTLEKKYFEGYLTDLVKRLFGHKPKIYHDKGTRTLRLVFYSKDACEFLVKSGFPKGLKSAGNMSFPKFIVRNKKNLSLCLRGLIDTDGSLSSHPHSKVMIHLSITNPDLMKSAFEGFRTLGIKAGAFSKGLMIYTPAKIKKIVEEIGFSNPKNLLKYETFLKKGKVPSSREIETFLRA